MTRVNPAVRIIFLAVCLLVISQCGAHAQWHSLRQGPEGRASLEYRGDLIIPEWYYTFKHNLRYKPGLAVWSSPALAVVEKRPMAFLGGHSQTLLALDLASRKVVWLKITNGEIGAAPAIGTIGNEPAVVFTSADRSVYAFRAVDGKKHWITELIPPSETLGDVSMSAPLIDGQQLFVTAFSYDKSLPRNRQNAFLFCLNLEDGRLLWRHEVSQGFVNAPVGFQMDGKFHILIASRKGSIQCFDMASGRPQLAWKYQMPHEVLGSPVVETDVEEPLLYIGSKFGNFTAINARNGAKVWQRMAGNWIDNTACLGRVKGRDIVYVGSHDYKLYAFDAHTGSQVWSRPLGGEVYSAPAFFDMGGRSYVAAACLDDRVYVVDAETGAFHAAFFGGEAIWDKVPKGETLMGSPVVLSAGDQSVLIHGAYSGTVCVFPLTRESTFRDTARSFKALWLSLPVVLAVFLGIVLPIVLWADRRRTRY